MSGGVDNLDHAEAATVREFADAVAARGLDLGEATNQYVLAHGSSIRRQ